MKCTLELNQEDIRQIIANQFKVDLPYVNVTTKKQSKGYGPTEHDVYEAAATLDIPKDRLIVENVRVPKEE